MKITSLINLPKEFKINEDLITLFGSIKSKSQNDEIILIFIGENEKDFYRFQSFLTKSYNYLIQNRLNWWGGDLDIVIKNEFNDINVNNLHMMDDNELLICTKSS